MVRQLYEDTADSYAQMMDSEIDLPVYSDMLSRLAERVASVPGPIIDTSCGSGHMLSVYHERWDPERALVGIDLSPRMVTITKTRLVPVPRSSLVTCVSCLMFHQKPRPRC